MRAFVPLCLCVSLFIASPESSTAAGKATARQASTPQKAAADVNRRAADGSTLLLYAVYDGNVAEVKRLLKAGANVSLANNYGASPMGLAAEEGNAEIIKLRLEAGANADSPNQDGQTALMAVARTG